MSLLIKNFDMPKSCMDCLIETDWGECGYYAFQHIPLCDTPAKGRRDDCPLIEIPNDSKLIDANKIGLTDFEIIMCDGDYKQALQIILNQIENADVC